MSAESAEKRTVFGMPYNVGVGVLCVLGAFCLYEFYSNVLAGPDIPAAQRSSSPAATASTPTIAMPAARETAHKAPASQRRNEEFSPALHSKRAEDRIDPNTMDPTLRLDLLAKVQGVEMTGGSRNLFQMGQPPPPPKTELAGVTPIVKPLIGPRRPPDPVQPPAVTGPPVIPLQIKFYGFTTVRNGKTTAYFMDGEDIILASEGEMFKKRYRVKSIQATSVLVEDTENKRIESIPLTPPESQS